MPAKRCPMCRQINRETAQVCDCGYEFGQEDIQLVLDKLRQQQSNGWALLGGGVLLLLVVVGMFIAMLIIGGVLRIGVPVLAIIGGSTVLKGSRMIATSRRSTRELEERMKLPPARVIQ